MSPSRKLFISTVRIYLKILLIKTTSGLVNSYFKEVKGIFSARTMHPVNSPLLHLLEAPSQTVSGEPWDKRSSSAK